MASGVDSTTQGLSERAVHAQRLMLGSILTREGCATAICVDVGVRPEYLPTEYGRLLDAALSLEEEKLPVHAFSLSERTSLPVEWIREAADRPPAHSDPAEFGKVIREEALWRARAAKLFRLSDAVEARSDRLWDAALTEQEQHLDADEIVSEERIQDEVATYLEQKGSPGLPLPFLELTRAFGGGARPGDTTMLGGLSSHGKSLIASQWLETVAREEANCALLTNEMQPLDVGLRIIASRTGINFRKLVSRELTPTDMEKIVEGLERMPFPVAPVFGKDAREIARMIMRHRWDLCVLDLFNRLPSRGSVQEVDEAVTILCDAAARSGTHLVICAQVSKRQADRNGIIPMPTKHDLRESSSLHTHPANVIFIYRKQAEIDGRITMQDEGVIYADKVRNGDPTVSVPVVLNTMRMRFERGQ